MSEIWKQIPGFGDFYEASDAGNIRVKTRIIMKPHSQSGKMTRYVYPGRDLARTPDGKGYYSVHIGVDGKKTKLRCCRAVLMAFVGVPPDGMEACHGDGNPANDSLSNLRWDTHLANNQDRKKHGNYAIGEAHKMAKLSEDAVREIRFGSVNARIAMQKFGIGSSQFYRIKRGETWPHIK